MNASKITSSKYFIPVTLFVLCFLLYGNTLWNGYAGDDYLYVSNKFILKGFSAFKDLFNKDFLYGSGASSAYIQQYRPLTMLNFMIEFLIFGVNPHVGHFFNVLFFAITIVLLYLFLQKVLKNYNRTIIFTVALLFAFHPIHTEVVANIKSRDEILSFLFGLISFYFIMLCEEKSKEVFPKKFSLKKNLNYIVSLTAFFVALFCKENAFTFLAIIPLVLYFFTGIAIKKIVFRTIPYVILACIYLFIRSHILQSNTFTHPIPVSDNSLMATDSNANRIAISFVLLGKYICMTIIPYPLSWDYSFNQIPIVSWGNIKPLLSLLVVIVLIGYAIWGIKRKSIFSFSILFFFITLSLSCNVIIKIAGTFAERFLYVPSLAFCIALPIFIVKSLELKAKNINKLINSKFLYLSFGCLLVIYTFIVIPRNAEWKNDFTLETSGEVISPNSEMIHNMLAFIYADSAKNSPNKINGKHYFKLAAYEFRRTIEISAPWVKDTDSYANLGTCFLNEGYPDSAIPAFNKVLQLKPKNGVILNFTGVAYRDKKEYDTALSYFFKSYEADSANFAPLFNVAGCYQNKKSYRMALYYDSILLQRVPDYKQSILRNISITHNSMGLQHFRNNELDSALYEFTVASNIDSSLEAPLKNIALVYGKMGNNELAKKYAQMAFEKDPNNRLAPNP